MWIDSLLLPSSQFTEEPYKAIIKMKKKEYIFNKKKYNLKVQNSS